MGLFDREKNKKSPETAAASPAVPENTLVPGVGRIPFPAYRGKEPYIFISYAHIDSDTVFPEIKCFNEQGYHVWYDEGIAPGNEWTEEIADALSGCSIFVVMMTPNAANSHNVRNEINYALDEKKPFVSIHLAETALRGGLMEDDPTVGQDAPMPGGTAGQEERGRRDGLPDARRLHEGPHILHRVVDREQRGDLAAG